MFFCNSCAEKKGWDHLIAKSRGSCEICGEHAACNDIPSKYLQSSLPESEDLGKVYGISMTITSLDGDLLEGVKVTYGNFTGVSDKNGRVILT